MDPARVLTVPLAELGEQARGYLEQSKAANIRRAYAADWRTFTAWCAGHKLANLPATVETVALFLVDHAGVRNASTLQRYLMSIAHAHEAAGADIPTASPAVRAAWSGIRRQHGTAQVGKAPAQVDELRRMVATLGGDLRGLRDRALLLLGFAGAFRRGELVGLDIADIDFTPAGLVVTVRHSKTDQEGVGRQAGIPTGLYTAMCPLRALGDWLAESGIADGPLFRPVDRGGHVGAARLNDRAVARIVQRTAAAAGLDSTRYAGHSLRAGLAASAAAAGVEERDIMRQTGHRSVAVMRRYVRDGQLFRANAAAAVGL
jgi:integrase